MAASSVLYRQAPGQSRDFSESRSFFNWIIPAIVSRLAAFRKSANGWFGVTRAANMSRSAPDSTWGMHGASTIPVGVKTSGFGDEDRAGDSSLWASPPSEIPPQRARSEIQDLIVVLAIAHTPRDGLR